jgi:DinB superfamily
VEALTEELRDLCEQIDNLKEDVLELTAPLTDEQFNWRPDGGRWSISECLAHLNVVDGLDLPLLEEAVAQGRAAGLSGSGPFHYGWLSRRFVRYQDGPVKIKMKAPREYRPSPGEPKEKVVAGFISIHDQMRELAVKSNGLDLARIKTRTPFPVINFSLGQRFAILTAHDRRHLRQAWGVRRHRDFPV